MTSEVRTFASRREMTTRNYITRQEQWDDIPNVADQDDDAPVIKAIAGTPKKYIRGPDSRLMAERR